MSYAAKVIADSTADGARLTTIEVQFQRFILAEFNTHRMLSRNSASSRAIPVERRIAQVREDPFVPEAFGKNKAGMQAAETLGGMDHERARDAWLDASRFACDQAEIFSKLGVHKQHANRLIELFAWHTVVVTSTEWENFFNLRTDSGAQPEMIITAKLMREAYEKSTPHRLKPGQWHLPYVEFAEPVDDEKQIIDLDPLSGPPRTAIKISVARCAAVSYERQNAEKPIEAYVKRHDEMLVSGHMSPFEHQAQVVEDSHVPPFAPRFKLVPGDAGLGRVVHNGQIYSWIEDGWFCGNLRAPFLQYRKTLPGEAVFTKGSAT